MTFRPITPAGAYASHSITAIQRRSISEPAKAADPQPAAKSNEVLSQPEREFFAGLYPQQAGEIRSYNLYRRDGITSTPAIGTNVDMKG